MTTCGSCIEIISDSQQIICLNCQTNFHITCAEEMMENGTIKKCSRCKNVTVREIATEKAKSTRSQGSKHSNKSEQARIELEIFNKTYEIEKRQLKEREELLKQKHDFERNFIRQQTLLLKEIEHKNDRLSVSTCSDGEKIQSWIDDNEQHRNENSSRLNRANIPVSSTKNENLATRCVKPVRLHLSEDSVAARKVIEKELPIFSGKPTEWPFFYSVFETSTKACSYNNEENLARLRSCLKGSALEAVKSYLMFPDMVPRVIETLKKYYGKPEFIMNEILQDIRNSAGPKLDDGESIINYSMKIDNLYLSLKFTELDPTLWNTTILYEVIHKLPPHLKYDCILSRCPR